MVLALAASNSENTLEHIFDQSLYDDNWTPYLFGYTGSTDHYREGTDQFYRGPIDNSYEILSVTNHRQRFMIFAYDDL